jgi:hypothetical protein
MGRMATFLLDCFPARGLHHLTLTLGIGDRIRQAAAVDCLRKEWTAQTRRFAAPTPSGNGC